MAYTATYHEDSDQSDDAYMSPTLPPDDFSPSTESDVTSPEHTPTTFNHSHSSHASPTGLLTQWTAHQCADWISALGLSRYAGLFVGMFSLLSSEELDGE